MMTATKATLTNPKNGDTITQEISTSQAAAICADMSGEFPRSLAEKYYEYGQLSEAQTYWLVKMAQERDKPRKPNGHMPKTAQRFALAAESMKYPKLTLKTETGLTIKLARAGQRSKTPGAINITDGRPYGENTWYGRILFGGELHTSKHATAEVRELLEQLESDPEGTAAAYGRETGCCCFCSRELTDERSTAVGYGPVCAERYGLRWG